MSMDICDDRASDASCTALSADEMAAYGWVLDHRRTDPARAAADLGLTRGQIDAAFAKLTALRLVVPDAEAGPEAPARVRAVDPDAVLGGLTESLRESIQQRQSQLQRVQEDFDRLRERFLRGRGETSPAGLEVIPSLEEVRAALNRASAECRTELMTSQPGGNRVPAAMEEALARDTALLNRGIRIRTLYHHTARFNGPSQAYVAAASALGPSTAPRTSCSAGSSSSTANWRSSPTTWAPGARWPSASPPSSPTSARSSSRPGPTPPSSPKPGRTGWSAWPRSSTTPSSGCWPPG
ncbi:hypothetical protein ACQEVX_24795 [Streptomyces syringium]|uniref:hypothetical protein n=1 Tax=Streptomyces syringium TaxID=76729 RepID=UPI003D8BE1A7